MTPGFADRLDRHAKDRPEFDRFYFNLHHDARSPVFVVVSAGIYPVKGLADGFLCAVVGDEQRNLRASDRIDETRVGPIAWEVLQPGRSWRLAVAANPTGVELDVIWRARAPVHEVARYVVPGEADFAHYFQSGRYSGRVWVDGAKTDVEGWFGQRDRSRGRRAARDRLGMHLWIQAQLPGESIGLLYNEDRDGRPSHVDGAIMRENGTRVLISAVRHSLMFGEDLELDGGRFRLDLEDGSSRTLAMRSTGRGIYMAGGGHGGWHGVDHGPSCIEHERWPLDGSRNPRNLPIGITDALCVFDDGDKHGPGVAEYAVTRSRRFRYVPTLT